MPGNDIHGAPKKSGEWRVGEQRYVITSRGSSLVGGDARTALGNDIHGAPKKSGEWRIGEQHYAITSQGSRLEG